MPPLPEIYYVYRFIGRVKVYRKPDSKHTCKSYRHIAVSAEIKIQLQRIEKNRKQSLRGIDSVINRIKCPVHSNSKGIGY